MKILDLFSGTGGFSEAFLQRGHSVIRVDNDKRFRDVPCTRIIDVLDSGNMDPIVADRYDVIVASPPCQAFSLSSVRHHFKATATCGRCRTVVTRLKGERWTECCCSLGPKVVKDSLRMVPKSEFGALSLKLVARTLDLVQLLEPSAWWMENPRATMQHFVPEKIAKTTVWYCQYGDTSAKPTHLWGNWPGTWTPRPECHNGNAACHHQKAKRGAKTGTQGKAGAVVRAMVPFELSLEVCLAVEQA